MVLGNLTERVLAERTTGVPRRMALGTLFVLVTIFCVLFRILTLLRATAGLILAAGVLAVCLAVGQALLFDGRRPRDASILVGACILPVIVFFAACLETVGSERWSDAWPAVLSCTAMALCVGPVIGYLVGIFLAGGFFMFEHWWLGTNTIGRWIGPAEPQPMDGQVLRWLQKQPAQFRVTRGVCRWLSSVGVCYLPAWSHRPCVIFPSDFG